MSLIGIHEKQSRLVEINLQSLNPRVPRLYSHHSSNYNPLETGRNESRTMARRSALSATGRLRTKRDRGSKFSGGKDTKAHRP